MLSNNSVVPERIADDTGTLRSAAVLTSDSIADGDDDSEIEVYEMEGGYFRFIIKPTSLRRIIWDLFILVLLAVVFVTVPVGMAFGERFDRYFSTADLVIDSIFLFDVLTNFLTGYRPDPDDEYVEMGPGRIAKNYITSWFFLDVLSCPSVLMEIMTVGSLGSELSMLKLLKGGKMLKMLKLVKLLKMLRVTKMLGKYALQLEEFFMKSTARVYFRLFNLLIIVTVSSHLLACLWLSVSATAGETSWMYSYRDGADDDSAADSYQSPYFTEWSMLDQYITAAYFAITVMSTVGFGDICPNSTGERVFTIVAMVAGGGLYGYIIGTLAAVVTEKDMNKKLYYERMETIHSYMHHRHISPELRHKVHRHFRKFFATNSALDEQAILNDLSETLRLEIMAAITSNSVSSNYLFRDLPSTVVGRLSMIIKPTEVAASFGPVITRGEAGSLMFFITAGVANCFREERADDEPNAAISGYGVHHCMLMAGDCFGEMVGLGLESKYNATVCASPDCDALELLMLTHKDFVSVFPEKSETWVLCRARAKEHSEESPDVLTSKVSALQRTGKKVSLKYYEKNAGKNGRGLGEDGTAKAPAPESKRARFRRRASAFANKSFLGGLSGQPRHGPTADEEKVETDNPARQAVSHQPAAGQGSLCLPPLTDKSATGALRDPKSLFSSDAAKSILATVHSMNFDEGSSSMDSLPSAPPRQGSLPDVKPGDAPKKFLFGLGSFDAAKLAPVSDHQRRVVRHGSSSFDAAVFRKAKSFSPKSSSPSSQVSEGRPSFDDGFSGSLQLPVWARNPSRNGATTRGGGQNTLPAGFADSVFSRLDDALSDLAMLRRTQERTVATIKANQEETNARLDYLERHYENAPSQLGAAEGARPTWTPDGCGGGGGGSSSDHLRLAVSAKWLDSKDSNGLSDPYFKVCLDDGGGGGNVVYESEVVRRTLAPTWEPATVPLGQPLLAALGARPGAGAGAPGAGPAARPLVVFEVWDWDRDGPDGGGDFLGSVAVPLAQLASLPAAARAAAPPGAGAAMATEERATGGDLRKGALELPLERRKSKEGALKATQGGGAGFLKIRAI